MRTIAGAWVLLLILALLRVSTWYATISAPVEGCWTKPVDLHGDVISVRAPDPGRLLIGLKVADSSACPGLAGVQIRLSSYGVVERASPGDTLRVNARLKPAWGTRNPGAFDYRRWLFANGFQATGYATELLGGHAGPQGSVGGTRNVHDALVHRGLLRALAFGERSGVGADTWALLRDTGTVHLMVISGLHVGIFATFTFCLAYGPLRCVPGAFARVSRRRVASMASAAAVGAFAWRTGLQPPVLRASAMVLLALACVATDRRPPWLNGLALICLVALIAEPATAFHTGFWLSYLAVAILLCGFASRLMSQGPAVSLLRCQALLFAGLTPWLALLVGEVPLVATVANVLTVPLVSLVTVPGAMFGFLFLEVPGAERLGAWLLWLADVSIAVGFAVLVRCADPMPSIGYLGAAALGGASIACAGWLLTPSLRWRGLAGTLWVTLVLTETPLRLSPGHFRLTVLDVGQGSAAIVDTARHRLVVDAGARYPSGYDNGSAVVIPALRATGPDRVNRIVLSHADLDHAGGLPVLRARYPAASLISPDRGCAETAPWTWDGVEFTPLMAPAAVTRNDRSCTVLVSNGEQTIYLSGDIGHRSERLLQRSLPAELDLLVAPHHGSGHSSHRGFVRHLRPRYAVFSAGFLNRYRHPHPDVLTRYRSFGTALFCTARDGAVTFVSSAPARLHVARRVTGYHHLICGADARERDGGEGL